MTNRLIAVLALAAALVAATAVALELLAGGVASACAGVGC